MAEGEDTAVVRTAADRIAAAFVPLAP